MACPHIGCISLEDVVNNISVLLPGMIDINNDDQRESIVLMCLDVNCALTLARNQRKSDCCSITAGIVQPQPRKEQDCHDIRIARDLLSNL